MKKGTRKIKLKFGEVEFGGSGQAFVLPQKGIYAWPSDTNSLLAFMSGALYGPFKTEQEAKKFCESKYVIHE